MHTLCAEKSSAFRLDDDQWAFNNNIPEDFIAALKNMKEKEYAKAFDSLEICGDSYTPAKYQMACMYYDGLGRLENHVRIFFFSSYVAKIFVEVQTRI